MYGTKSMWNVKSVNFLYYEVGVLWSGFLRLITDRRSQKAVSADPITDTDLFIMQNYL